MMKTMSKKLSVILITFAYLISHGAGFHLAVTKQRSPLTMSYEIVDSMTPLFTAQLAGCASVIGSGFVVKGSTEEVDSAAEQGKIDIYRDTPLRYAGYLNEVGEAFRPLIPVSFVILSYVLAITYVGADAVSKGFEFSTLNEKNEIKNHMFGGLIAAIDTLGFQGFASIIFPGYIINRWVTYVAFLTFRGIDIPEILEKNGINHINLGFQDFSVDALSSAIPTIMGLALIPLIVKPLDTLTDFLLDSTVRPQAKKLFPDYFLPFQDPEL